VRTVEGGSEDGGVEELRDVWLTRSSSRPKRSSKVLTNTRTDAGVAAQSSGRIPAGGESLSINIALSLYHSPPFLTNSGCPSERLPAPHEMFGLLDFAMALTAAFDEP
jgi:hypothetical protein